MNVKAQRQKSPRRQILLWNRVDFDALRSAAKRWAEDFTNSNSTSTPIECLAATVQSGLENILKEHVPTKLSTTRFNQPWFNSATKRSSRRKKRAFKKARRTNKDRDWLRYRKLKRESQQACRQAHSKFISDIVCSDPSNKKLGALVKAKRCDQTGVAPLKNGNLVHSDPMTKANILNKQFS
jgi:hypothetical protein